MSDHVNSYYAATVTETAARAPLSSREAVDVCIVGAGFAGLSTALELARRGRSVCVLETNRVGWGASGRNGGFVTAGFAQGLDAVKAAVGLDRAREMFQLSRDGVAKVARNIETLGLDAAEQRPGFVAVMRTDRADEVQAERDALERDFGHATEYWPTDKVRTHLKSETYFQGLYDGEALHIHPLNYAIGLAAGCEAAGVRIFETTPAVRLERDGAAHRIVTPDGVVTARHVVLTHSAYGRGLSRALDAAVLPVATYVVTTTPEPGLLGRAIATGAAIADTRRAGDYYRLLPDGRLLWGGRITTQRSEPAQLAAMLKRDIAAIYPQLSGIEIDHAWSGLMAYAVHKMPIIGSLGDGLWMASAFGGHGLNTTAMAGELIAGAIADGDDRIKLFEHFGPSWAGGAIGRAATQVTYWSYQLRDWLEERKSRSSSQSAGARA